MADLTPYEQEMIREINEALADLEEPGTSQNNTNTDPFDKLLSSFQEDMKVEN